MSVSMALPTTQDGSGPPTGMPVWAPQLPPHSAQQHGDFVAVSAGTAQPHLVADFHRQQHLQHPPQHPNLVHHQQPHLQQHQQHQHPYAVYDPSYYQPSAEQYPFVPSSQAPIERHPYHPTQLGQLSDSALRFRVPPAPSEPQQPPAYNQPFASDDPAYLVKQESSPTSPPRQPASTTPPQPMAPVGRTHRQSVDETSVMPAQVKAATPVTTTKKKSTSATPTRKAAKLPSPKAGKKRAREETDVGGAEDDEDGEPEEQQKKRGRPRLTGGGKSRDERRRMQIRDAQRAYRNRKDNRIVELEEQVGRLEREKVDMSRDFGSVLDLVRSQGVVQTSAAIARRFDDLCQKYPMGALDYQDVDAQSAMSSGTGRERYGQHSHPRQTLGTISSASSDHHAMMSGGHVRPQAQGPHLSFGSVGASFYPPENLSYEVITQPTPENASFPCYAPDPRAPGGWIPSTEVGQLPPGSQPPMMPQHPQQMFFQQQLAVEQVLVQNHLANPNSSAALEATFGRRLQRRTLERGLSLAEMDNPPPDRFGAVFGFCLLIESREDIIKRLSSCLKAAKDEGLDYWRHPFTNLGGMSLPSERRGNANSSTDARTGNQDFAEPHKPQQMTGYSMGPFNAQVEAVKDSYIDKRMQISFPGFKGEFLDPNEVERYLGDRGIEIPALAEWVQADISTNDFGGSSETQTVPANAPVNCAQDAVASASAGRASGPDAITTMFTDGTVTGAADTGAMNPFLCPAVPMDSWISTNHSNPRFNATIQISTLVEEMVNRSVCLGRASGIRPKDIDRAVKIASGLYKPT